METISVGTAVSDAPGRTTGALTVGALPDGTSVDIPVVIVRGRKDGPVVWMHACVHGDEYCGTYTIHALLRRLDPDAMAGTVIALPVLNLTAFRKNQRMSPFEGFGGGDLNRCFPGRADGSVSEQMAHAIYGPLKRHANHVIDFHTAFTRDTRWALFSDYGGEVSQKARAMAKAFGYRDTLPAPPDLLKGSVMHSAGHDGIPVLIVENGGIGPAFDHESVEDAAERLVNVLVAVGVLEGQVRDYGPLTFFSNFAWVCATMAGLYERTVACGDAIEAGQPIGRYFDVFGAPAGEAVAPHAGIVLATHPGPVMARGETLIHIGLDPREA